MNKYPKMHLPYDKFVRQLPRLQNYLTNPKYWKQNNKNGQKRDFFEQFSLQKWDSLSHREKLYHTVYDCLRCENSKLINYSVLHKSATDTTENIVKLSTELAQEIDNKNSTGVNTILNVLEPIFQKEFQTNLKSVVSERYNLTEKLPSEQKRKLKIQQQRENTNEINKIITNNDNEVQNFLASGKSYSQLDRDRMSTFFEATESARARSVLASRRIKEGSRKARKHVGNMDNYSFDRDAFLKYIRKLPRGSRVVWRYLAFKFHVRNKNGLIPKNAGQVLQTFAGENGVHTDQFNQCQRVSGRDFAQRVRRSKRKIYKYVSIPTPRPARKLREEVKQKLDTNDIYIGEKIAPKTFRANKIDTSGTLTDISYNVHGRMIPIQKILDQMTEAHKDYQRNTDSTRHLKIWHDHSDILNHSYITIMLSTLYDTASFLTDDEYKRKYPDRLPADVQAMVEKPFLYILGQSSCSDVDQLSYMSYMSTRVRDLESLRQQSGEVTYNLRYFSGDGPARQFEAGHQRGGNFSCLCGIRSKDHINLACAFTAEVPSLQERMSLLRQGELWQRFSLTNPSPFANLKKSDLVRELEARGHDTSDKSKSQLQEELSGTLRGIQRPPAFFTTDEDVSDLLSTYEIPPGEPLHDITNIVQNLITELPSHIDDVETSKDFEKFSGAAIGDKNQIKGSDARLFAVKLAMFAYQKHSEKKISEDILHLCIFLVEIISICYSPYDQRTPKKILRLYNICFQFSVLLRSIVGFPKKMTSRKFYGCHFHSLTVHAPETFRLVCLRSLIPEQEERSFGDLRSISLHTANRQCGKVIDNAVLRYNAQQTYSNKKDYARHQDSMTSRQAKLLPKSANTKFKIKLLQTQPTLFQAHCQRIADYLRCGEGHWWSLSADGVVFHDGPEEPDFRHYPPLAHFRTTTGKEQQGILAEDWKWSIQKYEDSNLRLPLYKIKVHKDGELCRILKNEGMIY